MCKCKCGWTVYGGLAITIECPNCAQLIICEGKPIDPPELQPPISCAHRGAYAGTTSCGCGGVYRCELLNKLCAPRPMAMALFEINVVHTDGSTGPMLSTDYQSDSTAQSDSFQACSECPSFQPTA